MQQRTMMSFGFVQIQNILRAFSTLLRLLNSVLRVGWDGKNNIYILFHLKLIRIVQT